MTVHNVMISNTGQEIDAGGDSLHDKEALVTVRLNSGDIYRFHGETGVSLAASVVAQTAVLNVYLNGRQQPLVRAFGPASWATFEPATTTAVPAGGRFSQI